MPPTYPVVFAPHHSTGMSPVMAKTTTTPETVDSDVNDVVFSDTDLRGITSFEDALRLAAEKYGSVIDAADEIGSGFVMLDDKDKLVNEPFVIISYTFPEGDFRNDDGELSHFAVMRVVTKHGDRFVVTDGSHGIYSQLDEFYVRSGRKGGLLVGGGLRKSTYETEINGVMQPATTYYLNV